MRWQYTSTDHDWHAQHLINESLHHEHLFHQSMLLSETELTPPTEPLPKLTMARWREQKLQEEAQQTRDIWTDYQDEIEL
jgi:hypothetical protein